MFKFRRSAGSDAVQPIKDFKLDATYATTAKRFDLVKLNAAGDVVLAAAGDTAVLGVLEFINLKAQGDSVTTGGVRTDASSIYEVPASAAGAKVGVKYGVTVVNGGTVDVANTTNTCVVVVAIRPNGNLDVQITGRQLA